MEATRNHPSAATGRARPRRGAPPGRRRWPRCSVLLLAGCSVVATPDSAPVAGGPFAPRGALGYVVCPTAVTPVELGVPDGRGADPPAGAGDPAARELRHRHLARRSSAYVATQTTGPTGGTDDVVIPIDLVTQRAGRPIALPGRRRHPRRGGDARRPDRAGRRAGPRSSRSTRPPGRSARRSTSVRAGPCRAWRSARRPPCSTRWCPAGWCPSTRPPPGPAPRSPPG